VRKLLVMMVTAALALSVGSVATAHHTPQHTGKQIKRIKKAVKKLKQRIQSVQQTVVQEQQGLPGVQGAQGPTGPVGGVLPSVGNLLYVEDGTQEISHVTFTVSPPVDLEDVTELLFFQELVHGTGNFGANVILGVDADNDGTYEADDLAWHVGATTHMPAVLGGDTFVEMDGTDPKPSTTPATPGAKVDAPGVPQWYSPNAAGDGFPTGPSCYSTLQDMVENCADVRFDPTDDVRLVRLLLGGSGSWNDIAVRVTPMDLP
jgi:hypothetical protein